MTTISYSGFDQEADWEEGDLTDADAVFPAERASADFEASNTEYLSNASELFDVEADFTFLAWINAESLSAALTVFSQGKSDSITPLLELQLKTNGDLACTWRDDSGTRVGGTRSPGIGTGEDHQVGLQFEGDSGRIFVDGSQVGTDFDVSSGGTTTINQFALGVLLRTGTDRPFDGLMDEVSLWSRALSASEISDLYNGGTGVHYEGLSSTTGLTSWWALDEASGTREDSHGANDLSDNATVTQGSPIVTPEVEVTAAAALAGSYGAAFTIEDTTNRHVQFSGLSAETQITAEAKIDPSNVTMGSNEQFTFIDARDTSDFSHPFFANLVESGGSFFVRAAATLDSGSSTTSSYAITSGQHTIRIVGIHSSGVGNDDGELHLYIDGELKESLTGLDNDTRHMDVLNFGAAFGIDSGTSGVFFMDDMKWSNSLSATATQDAVLTTTATLLAGTLSTLNTTIRNFPRRRTRYTIPERVTEFNFGKRNTEFTFKVYDDD